MINGRLICLFKLYELVQVVYWQFFIVELLWFGEKCYLYEGWEYIEIVLLGDLEMLNVCVLVLFFDEGFSLLGILVKISLLKGEYE